MLDALMEAPASRKVLRPHQEQAIAMVRSSLAGGNRRVVLQGPVGFGKTLVAARLIEGALAKGNRVIFTAPMISLIDQTVKAFAKEGIHDVGVMQANHPRTDPRAPVQVASVQTLARREIPKASLVIVDECHVRAKPIEAMMHERPDVYFIGLSATPWSAGMGLLWQDLCIPCTTGSLIRDGYLSEFVAYAPDVPDLSGVKVERGEYVEDQLAAVMGDHKLVGSIVETWLAKGAGRPTLAFGVNRAHAAQMQQQFTAAGVATAYVDGMTDTVERNRIKSRFDSGEFKVICSVRTMTTGVDLSVSCIVDAAPTKSEILHVQKIGRGLRINPGTEDCVILDHAGNSLRLGLVTDIHHERLDDSKPGMAPERKPKAEKLPTACSKCETLFVGTLCPACGHERKPPLVQSAQGELVAVRGKAPKLTAAQKDERYAGLLYVASERGYNPGWAYHKYCEWHGAGPARKPAPRYPSQEVRNWLKSRAIAYSKARAAQ